MFKKWQIAGFVFSIFSLAPFAQCHAEINKVQRDFIAGGQYTNYNTKKEYPLLLEKKPSENTWNFSPEISKDMPKNMSDGGIENTSCTKDFCVAAGFYINDSEGEALEQPLLARLDPSTSKWSYLSLPLPSQYNAVLTNVDCNASSCIAVGATETKDSRFVPLLMTSTDGKSWSVSESVMTNLPKNIKEAEFIHSTCDDNGCIATGLYSQGEGDKETFLPLVAVSSDKGKTWNYSMNFMANKPNLTELVLRKVSCNPDACVIGGYFIQEGGKDHHVFLPFAAVSHDKGQNWFFPETIFTNMPGGVQTSDIIDVTFHNHTAYVVGYFDKYPLLAISKDKGVTWTYPDDIIKSNVNGGFSSISCFQDRCLAAGTRTLGRIEQPLFASSKNNGETWSYDDFWTPENIMITGATCNHDTCVASAYQERVNGLNTLLLYAKNDSSSKLNWQKAEITLPVGYERGELFVTNTLD